MGSSFEGGLESLLVKPRPTAAAAEGNEEGVVSDGRRTSRARRRVARVANVPSRMRVDSSENCTAVVVV